MQIDIAALLSSLRSTRELALLDVRENGVYTQGHAFPAVSAPLSRLELVVGALVPRTSTPIALMDGGDGLAGRAADRLRSWGYDQVSMLSGGIGAWKAAGLEIFSGLYVPSKAFGEYVGERCGTPALGASELKHWIDEHRDFTLVDCRPFPEFNRFSLPGSVNCPGAEIPHRAFSLASDSRRPIVVTCAGRTRGIVAAQALRNAGVPNPVYVLDNGTAAWYLMGETLAAGRRAVVPPATRDGVARAVDASLRVARRFGVRELDASELAQMRADERRTTYLFDVRSPQEYEAGHLPGSRSAPGGQLVQSVDHYVGVRNARIVLADDDGARARFTGSWLRQMGWTDVFVLDGGAFAEAPYHEHGPEPRRVMPSAGSPDLPYVSAWDARSLVSDGQAIVLDFQDSLGFTRSHIAGARFAVRSRIDQAKSTLDRYPDVICTSDDDDLARLAAVDVAATCSARVQVLRGGTAVWRDAGLPLESGPGNPLSAFDDVWYNPYDFDDLTRSLSEYLRWEIDLVHQIEREEFARFSCEGVQEFN